MTYLNHPTEYNRLMETAKKRALELRNDAIDDFWSGAGDAARRALRSATRLAHSIARHARLRHHLEA
jgi:hypothetical protein